MAYVILPSRRRRPDVFTLDYSHPLAQGLVLASMLRRGRDESLRNLHGAIVNIPDSSWYLDPEIGRHAVKFSGGTDHIAHPYKPSVVDFGSGGTYAAWLNFGTTSTDEYNGSWSAPRVYLGKQGSTHVFGWGSSFGYGASNAATPNVWTHLALTNNGSLSTFYVNGLQIRTLLQSFSGTQANNFGIGLCIGVGRPMHGPVSDTVLYNRPLSPAEIALLADRTDPMLEGLIRDKKPAPKHWHLGAYTSGDPGGTPYNLLFDGCVIVSADKTSQSDSNVSSSTDNVDILDSYAEIKQHISDYYDTISSTATNNTIAYDINVIVATYISLLMGGVISVTSNNDVEYSNVLPITSQNIEEIDSKSTIKTLSSNNYSNVSSINRELINGYYVVSPITTERITDYANITQANAGGSSIIPFDCVVKVSNHISDYVDSVGSVSSDKQHILSSLSSVYTNILQEYSNIIPSSVSIESLYDNKTQASVVKIQQLLFDNIITASINSSINYAGIVPIDTNITSIHDIAGAISSGYIIVLDNMAYIIERKVSTEVLFKVFAKLQFEETVGVTTEKVLTINSNMKIFKIGD